MRKTLPLLPLCIMLLFPRPAPAWELDGESRSFLTTHEASNDSRYLTFYEYLDSDAGAADGQGFSFHAGGWGRTDLLDESREKRSDGELQYAYLGYAAATANASIGLGRLRAGEGVASLLLLDGLRLGSELAGGLSVSAFAGIPVETGDDGRGGDLAYGGRISQGLSPYYRLGISCLREENDGELFREEAGADLSLWLFRFLDLTGRSTYDVDGRDWKEHNYDLTLRLSGGVTLSALADWIDYGAFFRSPVNPAFGADRLDPEEKMLSYGGRLAWEAAAGLNLVLDYTKYAYDIAGDASAFGGSLTWRAGGSGAGLSGRRMLGEDDDLRYLQYRAWGAWGFGPAELTLDMIDTRYDVEIEGVRDSWEASLGLASDIGRGFRLAADVTYAHNPTFDRDVRAFLKVLYRFGFGGEGGRS